MTEYTVSVCDPVKVFAVGGHRYGQPEGGWDGVVLKVGRVLVHIEYPGWPEDRLPQSFYKDTRQESSPSDARWSDPDSARWFEPAELAPRRQEAIGLLRKYGLDAGLRRQLPTEVLEQLAAVLTNYDNTKESPR